MEIFFLFVKLFFVLFFTLLTLYLSIRVINLMTYGIDEWEEIKKGNLAVGLFYFFSISSIFIMCHGSIEKILELPLKNISFSSNLYLYFIATINYFFQILFAFGMIYLGFGVLDKITFDIEESYELKKGNIAVSLYIGLLLLVIGLFTSGLMNGTYEYIYFSLIG